MSAATTITIKIKVNTKDNVEVFNSYLIEIDLL